MTNYAKKHPYLLGAIIISIVAITGFIFGYRIQPDLRIAKNGALEITLPLKNTIVYVDDKKLVTTEKENQTVTLPLSVNTHDIIIGREGYFPWMAQVITQSGKTTTLNPIFVTQNTTGQIITQKDPQYWTLWNQVRTTALPTETNPKVSGDIHIWVKDNTIYMKENEVVKKIITPKDAVRSLDFYKDRTDVIIFASDTGIYAMDAVENATDKVVNFFPLYKGAKPVFTKTENSFLYVLDGQNLMMVVL